MRIYYLKKHSLGSIPEVIICSIGSEKDWHYNVSLLLETNQKNKIEHMASQKDIHYNPKLVEEIWYQKWSVLNKHLRELSWISTSINALDRPSIVKTLKPIKAHQMNFSKFILGIESGIGFAALQSLTPKKIKFSSENM